MRFEPDVFDSSGSIDVRQRGLGADGQPLPTVQRGGQSWLESHGDGFFALMERVSGFSRTSVFAGHSGLLSADGRAPVHFGFDYLGQAFNSIGDGLAASRFSLFAHPVTARPDAFQGHHAIELSPFTELRWTGTLTLEAKATPRLPGLRRAFAQAEARFELLDSAGRLEDGLDLRLDTRQPGSPELLQRALSLSLANRSGEATHGRLVSAVSLHGATFRGATPAVPEPGSWALLAAGLGVVGEAAARRRAPTPA